MQEQLDKVVPSVFAIDIAEVHNQLKELLENYRDALRITYRLPTLGRLKARVGNSAAKLKTRNRWVIGPFVRLFVELHIRAKIRTIANALRIEGVSLDERNSEALKKINFSRKRLTELKADFVGWGAYYQWLTKAPLLSTLLPLAAATLLSIWGVDYSDAAKLGGSLTKLGGWSFVVGSLKVIGIWMIYFYLLFAAVVVRFGFRCKRAIFQSGETVTDLFSQVRDIEKWENMPQANIYQTENCLFAALKLAKPKEFPLDLIGGIAPYYMLVFTTLFTVEAVVVYRTTGGYWRLIGSLFSLFTVFFLFFSGWQNYRKRRNAGNV